MHNRDALVQIKYTGATPGADTNAYVLFSSVTAFSGARMAQGMGLKRFYLSLAHSDDGTIVVEKSDNRGTTWIQVFPDIAVTATADTDYTLDVDIEAFPDFRISWVNASQAQDPWVPNMALTDERVVNT